MKYISRFTLLALLMSFMLTVTAQDDDLRIINFDVGGDFYAEIELTIEADDVSILFNAKTSDADDNIYLTGIYTFDDELIYELDNEESVIAFGLETFTEESIGQLSVFIPSSSNNMLDPGDYLFVFEAESSEIISVSALIRSGDVDSTQAIDLNIWLLTQEINDMEGFADAIRDGMDETLNPHGLEVGEINFLEASDEDYEDFSYPQIDDEDARSLEEICATMSETVGTDRALNVAIIEGFDEGSEEGGTAGIAINAGNAGVILESSAFSCVVVSYEIYGEDFASQAANILHEGSHFMSLPHTTESEGDLFDLFDDTPECDAQDFDENGDGVVDDFECDIEGGANNLMFWSGEPEYAPYILSDSQAWVIRRHPLFYGTNFGYGG